MRGDGPTGTRVSAVLTANNLVPENVARTWPSLWPNPWAARPLTVDLPFPRGVATVERVVSYQEAAGGPHSILGLPEDWPGPKKAFSKPLDLSLGASALTAERRRDDQRRDGVDGLAKLAEHLGVLALRDTISRQLSPESPAGNNGPRSSRRIHAKYTSTVTLSTVTRLVKVASEGVRRRRHRRRDDELGTAQPPGFRRPEPESRPR
jgi:hypothetical protein